MNTFTGTLTAVGFQVQRIVVLAFIGCMMLFALVGCGGDFASPTTTDYQATTTTTTTTTAATAEMTQTHNKSTCVGILNIGSCNTTQVSTQSVNRPAGVPTPTDSYPSNLGELGGGLMLIMACFFVVFVGACFAMGTRQ